MVSRKFQENDEPVPGYHLVEYLGQGGFGEVWKATGPGGIEVAIKFIFDLSRGKGGKELRALRLLKGIRHPNLVPIVAFWLKDQNGLIIDDLQGSTKVAEIKAAKLRETLMKGGGGGEHPSELIIAMGLAENSLFDRLEECQGQGLGGIPQPELLTYMEDAARAIDYLNNEKNIQHCDIKPQNILIVSGAAQVCDFGLAKAVGDLRQSSMAAMSVAYASPEVAMGQVPTSTTDQYSLAISYYELRTGRFPFVGNTFKAVLDAKQHGTMDFSGVTEPEQEILARACSIKPTDRFSTCAQMVRRLRRCCPEEESYNLQADTDSKPQPPQTSTGIGEIVPGYKRHKLVLRRYGEEVWEARGPGKKKVALVVRDLEQAGRADLDALSLILDVKHENISEPTGFWLLDEKDHVIPDDAPLGIKPAKLVICGTLADTTLMHRTEQCRRKQGAGIPRDELLPLFEKVAAAVDYLNEPRHALGSRLVGIQHGSLRPANFLLYGNQVLVGNFGRATVLAADAADYAGEAKEAWAAPELHRGIITRQSDQFSLAVAYYEMRTATKVRKLPLDLSLLEADEAAAVSKAMAEEPRDRYHTCLEFAAALHAQQAGGAAVAAETPPPEAPPESPPEQPIVPETAPMPIEHDSQLVGTEAADRGRDTDVDTGSDYETFSYEQMAPDAAGDLAQTAAEPQPTEASVAAPPAEESPAGADNATDNNTDNTTDDIADPVAQTAVIPPESLPAGAPAKSEEKTHQEPTDKIGQPPAAPGPPTEESPADEVAPEPEPAAEEPPQPPADDVDRRDESPNIAGTMVLGPAAAENAEQPTPANEEAPAAPALRGRLTEPISIADTTANKRREQAAGPPLTPDAAAQESPAAPEPEPPAAVDHAPEPIEQELAADSGHYPPPVEEEPIAAPEPYDEPEPEPSPEPQPEPEVAEEPAQEPAAAALTREERRRRRRRKKQGSRLKGPVITILAVLVLAGVAVGLPFYKATQFESETNKLIEADKFGEAYAKIQSKPAWYGWMIAEQRLNDKLVSDWSAKMEDLLDADDKSAREMLNRDRDWLAKLDPDRVDQYASKIGVGTGPVGGDAKQLRLAGQFNKALDEGRFSDAHGLLAELNDRPQYETQLLAAWSAAVEAQADDEAKLSEAAAETKQLLAHFPEDPRATDARDKVISQLLKFGQESLNANKPQDARDKFSHVLEISESAGGLKMAEQAKAVLGWATAESRTAQPDWPAIERRIAELRPNLSQLGDAAVARADLLGLLAKANQVTNERNLPGAVLDDIARVRSQKGSLDEADQGRLAALENKVRGVLEENPPVLAAHRPAADKLWPDHKWPQAGGVATTTSWPKKYELALTIINESNSPGNCRLFLTRFGADRPPQDNPVAKACWAECKIETTRDGRELAARDWIILEETAKEAAEAARKSDDNSIKAYAPYADYVVALAGSLTPQRSDPAAAATRLEQATSASAEGKWKIPARRLRAARIFLAATADLKLPRDDHFEEENFRPEGFQRAYELVSAAWLLLKTPEPDLREKLTPRESAQLKALSAMALAHRARATAQERTSAARFAEELLGDSSARAELDQLALTGQVALAGAIARQAEARTGGPTTRAQALGLFSQALRKLYSPERSRKQVDDLTLYEQLVKPATRIVDDARDTEFGGASAQAAELLAARGELISRTFAVSKAAGGGATANLKRYESFHRAARLDAQLDYWVNAGRSFLETEIAFQNENLSQLQAIAAKIKDLDRYHADGFGLAGYVKTREAWAASDKPKKIELFKEATQLYRRAIDLRSKSDRYHAVYLEYCSDTHLKLNVMLHGSDPEGANRHAQDAAKYAEMATQIPDAARRSPEQAYVAWGNALEDLAYYHGETSNYAKAIEKFQIGYRTAFEHGGVGEQSLFNMSRCRLRYVEHQKAGTSDRILSAADQARTLSKARDDLLEALKVIKQDAVKTEARYWLGRVYLAQAATADQIQATAGELVDAALAQLKQSAENAKQLSLDMWPQIQLEWARVIRDYKEDAGQAWSRAREILDRAVEGGDVPLGYVATVVGFMDRRGQNVANQLASLEEQRQRFSRSQENGKQYRAFFTLLKAELIAYSAMRDKDADSWKSLADDCEKYATEAVQFFATQGDPEARAPLRARAYTVLGLKTYLDLLMRLKKLNYENLRAATDDFARAVEQNSDVLETATARKHLLALTYQIEVLRQRGLQIDDATRQRLYKRAREAAEPLKQFVGRELGGKVLLPATLWKQYEARIDALR